jgi:hypothetical protein
VADTPSGLSLTPPPPPPPSQLLNYKYRAACWDGTRPAMLRLEWNSTNLWMAEELRLGQVDTNRGQVQRNNTLFRLPTLAWTLSTSHISRSEQFDMLQGWTDKTGGTRQNRFVELELYIHVTLLEFAFRVSRVKRGLNI